MIKHYCDSCGNEVTQNVVSDRLIGHKQIGGKKIMVEVILGLDGVWNKGDICKQCALALIASVFSAKARPTKHKAG